MRERAQAGDTRTTHMKHRARGSRSLFLSLAVCVSAALSACGGGDGGSPAASTSPLAQQPSAPPSPSPDPIPDPTPAPPTPGANSAPTISGAAMQSVNADSAYSFAPSASDADGDALSFQIENKPAWATFNTLTGELSGTPTPAHAGAYANISISVSDGQASASLPPFSITVAQTTIDGDTLYWIAPTANEHGGALIDLAGFMIAYGPSRTTLYKSVRINNPSVNRWVLENLEPGTHYFAVSAYTASGVLSAQSNVVSKVVE
jgi:hypothetical protein